MTVAEWIKELEESEVVIEVSTVRFSGFYPDDKVEIIREQYTGISAQEAMLAYYNTHCTNPSEWINAYCQEINPNTANDRLLLNYEKDPDNEVSEGYLSNLAIGYTNQKHQLAHTPTYCTHAHFTTFCPECGSVMTEREGTYGTFYTCTCGQKFGKGTKKYAKNTKPTNFCGEKNVAMINNEGVSFAGCPIHSSSIDHSQDPISKFCS